MNLAKFLKNTLKFSNFGNMQTAACNSSKKWSFSEVFEGFCLLFRNRYFKELFLLAAFVYNTPV